MTAAFTNPWRLAGWGFALALLLTPLVMMQVSDEWRWGPGDFVVAAILIGGTGLGIELVVRRSGNIAFRCAAALALLGTFLLIWINAAVHLVRDMDSPYNLLIFVIPIIGLAGGWRVRWQAEGLARVMLAMAAAQTLLAVFVLATSNSRHALALLVLTAPWLLSSFLFRRA